MTWYEIIISREDDDAIVISGRELLTTAVHFLDTAAKNNRIPGSESVKLYDEVRVPGTVLAELLKTLRQDGTWVDHRTAYEVLLTEI